MRLLLLGFCAEWGWFCEFKYCGVQEVLRSSVCRTDGYILNAKDKACVSANLQENYLLNNPLSSQDKKENTFISIPW